MEEARCKDQGRHEAHKWLTWTNIELWCPGNWRPALMNDLAILKLHLEDDLINDGQAGEALARVVGALDLSAEEEDWLEQQ
jgi:hypothetical protein